MAARVLDKPIKLVLTRAQMYSIVGYQPWMTQEVTLAAETNGTLTGIRHDVTNITAKTDDYVEFGSATSSALYRSPAISTSQRVRRGHVNLPTFMRSPIDGPGTWALGSAMDELARATGTDPLDLRLINYADLEPATGKPWSSKRLLAGVRRRRPPIRLAKPSPRRLARWQLVSWVRVGRRNPGAISLPLTSSTHARSDGAPHDRSRVHRHRTGPANDLPADRRQRPRASTRHDRASRRRQHTPFRRPNLWLRHDDWYGSGGARWRPQSPRPPCGARWMAGR